MCMCVFEIFESEMVKFVSLFLWRSEGESASAQSAQAKEAEYIKLITLSAQNTSSMPRGGGKPTAS